MVIGWDRYSPRNFVFNAKLPQTITHERLEALGKPIEEELDKFASLMLPLNNNGKLGCLLIQLPPRYKYDSNHLEEFLSLLPHSFKYAIEFRHKSGYETRLGRFFPNTTSPTQLLTSHFYRLRCM